jgi:Na+:H+ antiporter, NhaA family
MRTVTAEKLPRPEKVITSLLSPVERFIRTEGASGIALIGAALVAFVWANSPGSDSYVAMKEITVGVRFGGFELEKPLVDWVNDFLMAIFFFLVGLEIKRELLVGELASLQKAALPAAGAFGGMLVPALIYAGLNWDGAVRGWGVPMATDIAFAVGVLALLGPRVLLPAKVFLLALAIVDDLGAVAVIALFYTQALNVTALFIALSVWALAILYGRARGSNAMIYPVLGLVVWYFMLQSNVHATVAGVLMAMSVPIRHGMGPKDADQQTWRTLQEGGFERVEVRMEHLQNVLEQGQSPLHRMERALTPYVAYLIMPVFALFNAGVVIADSQGALVSAVSLGAFFGLLLGKPIGIVGFAWLAVRAGLAELPERIDWRAMVGVGLLGGIGFTMALFIAGLAFEEAPALLDQAKLGVLAASVIAATLGLILLASVLPSASSAGARAAG